MKLGVPIPQYVGDGGFDPAALRAYLARVEELGFDSVWAQEQVLGTIPFLSPLEVLTYAAACTERLRLGCAVFTTPTHVPVQLAKDLASLDQLSRGRLEVGVGVGHRALLPAFGLDPAGVVSRFTEGLQLMRALWTEPSVTFDGRFSQLREASMEPKPFQKPGPPVWIGGSHPAALRRAVTHGAGFFGAGSTTTERFADEVRTVREELDRQQRDPAGFRIAKRVYLAVDDDADRARDRLADVLGRVYSHAPPSTLLPVTVSGPADACVAGLQAVADAGAELILLNPMYDEADQLERLTAEVVPHLR